MAKSAKKSALARPQGGTSPTRLPKGARAAQTAAAASGLPETTAKASNRAGNSKANNSDSATKQSRVLAMLRSPAGATIAAMMMATGWQQHSVRGFLAGVVRKRLKLALTSKKVDGNRVYRIADSGDAKDRSGQSKRRAA